MSGEADLHYTEYDSSSKNQSYSGSSFAHRYSILYDTAGTLADGRLGKYELSLGYEWLAYDTTEKQSGSSKTRSHETRDHFNYRGDVILNPKELPLRLHLYSLDPTRSTFSMNESSDPLFNMGGPSVSTATSASGSNLGGYTHVAPNLINGIDNGIHVTNGATLVMGVKNGMTNGYNEVLRHFPMLMLDYKDQIDKDLHRTNPVDTRLSRLAFVSLNKKDNWFHYRYVTYDDKIDSSNNFSETQYQLGTVDHQLQRRWIDFTNWLNVSVDGQFTRHMNARTIENFDEISLNLFGRASRQSWEMRTYNNFTRLNELTAGKITYSTTLPVYANGIISPTAGWSAYAKYDNSHTTTGDSFTTTTGGYSIDSFRRSPFTLTQGLTVEQVSVSSGKDALILTGNIGTASTLLYSKKVSLQARYDIRNYRTGLDDGTTNNFLDQEIKATVRYQPTNQLNIIAQQNVRLTSGSQASLSSPIEGAEINSVVYQENGASLRNSGGSGYQSITDLRVDWSAAPRLRFGMSGSENIYVPNSGERETMSKLTATLDYNGSNLKISSNNIYTNGDIYNSDASRSFSSTNSASVIFNRSLDARVGLSYLKTYAANGSESTFVADQSLNYRYNANNGSMRSLFEINESFASIQEVNVDGGIKKSGRHNTLQLVAKYFPIRQLMIAGGGKYYFLNSGENGAINYYGSITLGFRLLVASIDYTYGKNKADGRVEKRISANLKKIF
ncbi:MAG: hypothetical protein WA003_03215 [Desulfuromonadaceae bacterium]